MKLGVRIWAGRASVNWFFDDDGHHDALLAKLLFSLLARSSALLFLVLVEILLLLLRGCWSRFHAAHRTAGPLLHIIEGLLRHMTDDYQTAKIVNPN